MAAAMANTAALLCIKASSRASLSSKRRNIRRSQNVHGDLFVDNACIDCDTCRWMAPEVFNRQGGMSAVFKQPTSQEKRLRALQALLSCPTNSIHTEKVPHDIQDVHQTFPIPVDDHRIQGVYHCGYHSEKSYSASSYIITHPKGNILIDSPRYTAPVAKRIREMGGIRYMFLTHRDDIADHKSWSKEFGCSRILHSEEVGPATIDVEMKLEGSGPWTFDDDIIIIFTPGHTQGCVRLFDKKRKVLFTGDHLFLRETRLGITEEYNFFSSCSCAIEEYREIGILNGYFQVMEGELVFRTWRKRIRP